MNIRVLLVAASLAATLLLTPGVRAATELMDQVVAIVDDDIIMASELRERVDALIQTLKSRGMDIPPEDEIIRETLDRLILESIQLQKGLRVGVRISDAQLDAAIQNIAAQNRMTLEQFRAAVEQQGQSYPEMREQVRKEMDFVLVDHMSEVFDVALEPVEEPHSARAGGGFDAAPIAK